MPSLIKAQEILPLWPEGVPNAKKTDIEELVVNEDSRRISQVVVPTIEIYLPSKNQAKTIGVIICSGGGYARLAYDKEGVDIAKMLNKNGIAAFVLKYRLPDEATNIAPTLSPLMDAKRAMEMVRENAVAWNIDTEKVGVCGFSAGGHLASTLGTHFEEANRPSFMVLLYPVVTMQDDFTHGGSKINLIGKNASKELVNEYSNELQVKDTSPTTFIVHSMDDKAVPVENSLQFATALNAKNVPVEMHIYPTGGHGFGLAANQSRLSGWPKLLVTWLKDLN